MRRIVLVDAYNAVYRLFEVVPEDRDASRRLLVHRVQEVLAQGDAGGIVQVLLVFDTLPGADRAGRRGAEGRVAWHYPVGSADDAILEEVRQRTAHAARVRVVVVTNDRELRGRARQLGASVRTVDAFFRRRERSPHGPPVRHPPEGPPLTASDFGLPEGDIDLDDPGGRFA